MVQISFLSLLIIVSLYRGSGQMKTKADLIVKNAIIYCVDKNFQKEQAFSVKNGKIIAVGTSEAILSSYSSDNIIDAQGKYIYPGFIDAHSHFYGYSLSLQFFDLTGIQSFDALLALLQKGKEQAGGWIVGRGWDQNIWKRKVFPDREKLDSLFPDRPVVLERIDGHVILVNGAALRKTGMMEDHHFNAAEIGKR